VNFYRKFIDKCSSIVKPLYELTRKDITWKWTSVHKSAFKKLKDALCKEPVLKHPNFKKPFILETDASGIGLGAVIKQQHDGIEHPVSYASRTLTNAESNYSTIERECKAIVWGMAYFKHFLLGNLFILRTDHKPLLWLLKSKELDDYTRLAKWTLKIQAFHFQIEYKKGEENVIADTLSRIQVLFIHTMTKEDISRLQQEDAELLNATSSEKYQIIDSLIHYKRNVENSFENWKLVIPASMRLNLIRYYHDDPLAGAHLGKDKTAEKILEHFYWPKANKEILQYVNSCERCNRRKNPSHKNIMETMKILAVEPWELVGMDILKMPVSDQGNKYILLFVDYVTKFVEAIPLQTKDAKSVAIALIQKLICRYGPPKKTLK